MFIEPHFVGISPTQLSQRTGGPQQQGFINNYKVICFCVKINVHPGVNSIQTNFHNIPVNLFSKSINELLQNDVIEIPDFKDEKIPTFGLKYVAEENGCKSGYLFAIKTIDGRFIGTLGLDYTKRKTNLDMESINHLQVHASSLGGVLMTHLNQ